MTFTEITIKLSKLLEIKEDLELQIKSNIIKLSNSYFLKKNEDRVKQVEDLIATLDKQLIEVKLGIQFANANEGHEDKNSNNYYIYLISSLNRRLAILRDLDVKREYMLKSYDSKSSLKRKPTNIITKKEFPAKEIEIADKIKETETQISELKPKLTNFNNRVEVKVKVLEGFESMFK